jgi:hypothetical protein
MENMTPLEIMKKRAEKTIRDYVGWNGFTNANSPVEIQEAKDVLKLIAALEKCVEQRNYVMDYPVSHEECKQMVAEIETILRGSK